MAQAHKTNIHNNTHHKNSSKKIRSKDQEYRSRKVFEQVTIYRDNIDAKYAQVKAAAATAHKWGYAIGSFFAHGIATSYVQ